MITRLQELLNIKPGEGQQVLLLTLYYFFITAISIAGRAASNSLFLSRVPNAEAVLPLLLIAVTVATTLIVTAYTRLARRVNLVALLTISGLFFSGVLLAIIPLLNTNPALIFLYIWLEMLNIVMFFQFYIFAGTIFDTRQAKRVFGILGIGGAVATILSGLGLRPFIARFSPEAVLFAAIIFVLLSLVMVWAARPYMRPELAQKPAPPTGQEARERIRLGGYLKAIIVVLAATIMVATLLDYQYKVLARRSFVYDETILSAHYGLQAMPLNVTIFRYNEIELTAFFGLVSAVVGVLQLGSRLMVGSVLGRFGILAGLLLLPMAMGVNALAVFLFPVIITGALIKGFDQVIRYTFNETAMELLWVPVSPTRKLAFKPFINGTIPSLMQGVSGLLILVLVAFFPEQVIQIISLVIIGTVAVWLPVSYRLRQGYINELMTSIQQHELVLQDLDLDAADATIVATIDRALREGDDVERAFILSLLEDMPPTPWAQTLNHLFHEESYFIRQKVLSLTADYPDIITNDELMAIIRAEPGDITDEAIVAAARRGLTDIVPLLNQHLRYRDYPEIRAAAAKAAILMNEGPVKQAQAALAEMLESRNIAESVIALNALAALPTTAVNESILREMLLNRSLRTRVLVFQVIENPDYMKNDREIIKVIAQNMEKPATRLAAQRVLKNYPAETVIETLALHYRDRTTSDANRLGIIQTLAQYPHLATITHLISFLDLRNLTLYTEIIRVLLLIARQQPLQPEHLTALEAETMKATRAVYSQYRLLHLLGDGSSEPLLYETVVHETNRTLPALLKLSVMDVPKTQIESIIVRVQTPEPQHIANVLEILDNVLSRTERAVIIPLFEGRPVAEISTLGGQHFNDLPRNLDDKIEQYILYGDEWQSLIALDFALRNRREALLRRLDWAAVPVTRGNHEIISDYLQRDNGALQAVVTVPAARFPLQEKVITMYSVLEKTIILKKVAFLSDIEPRELFHIAQIAEEHRYKENQVIFHEGDTGDGLYIIAEGQVRVHKGSQEITVLGKNEGLGEMSLFDHLPRSASVTTLAATTVFKISQERFQEVLVGHPEVMQAIVRTLSLRLRAATEQAMQAGRV